MASFLCSSYSWVMYSSYAYSSSVIDIAVSSSASDNTGQKLGAVRVLCKTVVRPTLPHRHFVRARQGIRVSAHQKDESRGLRIRFRTALFPLFQCSFVNPQFAREYGSRATQLFSS